MGNVPDRQCKEFGSWFRQRMAPGQRVRQPRNASPSQGQRSRTPLITSASTSQWNVRGINRGKGLERLIKRIGHPLNLNISEERRPIGENNELLSREIGLVTRYHAPIQYVGWHNLSEVDKEPLYALLKLKFNLDFTEANVKGCVELLFASSYKSFRHKCYNHYMKFGGGENSRSNPYLPLVGRVDDWLWLCDLFETEEFQKRSTIGRVNRLKLPYVHKKGTKSFVALQHELNCVKSHFTRSATVLRKGGHQLTLGINMKKCWRCRKKVKHLWLSIKFVKGFLGRHMGTSGVVDIGQSLTEEPPRAHQALLNTWKKNWLLQRRLLLHNKLKLNRSKGKLIGCTTWCLIGWDFASFHG